MSSIPAGNDLGEEGLYYFNARWYDPELGRFITEDPIKDGLNWYAYVSNNPLNKIDPTGLEEANAPGLIKQYYENTVRGAVDFVGFAFLNGVNSVKNAISNLFKGNADASVNVSARLSEEKFKVGVTFDNGTTTTKVDNPVKDPGALSSQLQSIASLPIRQKLNDEGASVEAHIPVYANPVVKASVIAGVGAEFDGDVSIKAGVKVSPKDPLLKSVIPSVQATATIDIPTTGDAPTIQAGNFEAGLSNDQQESFQNAVKVISGSGL